MSQTFNLKGYYYPETEVEDRCVNCHFCEAICPDFAIFSLEVPPKT
jgi:2-oxoglutarate ferredoxin oxidoreductase subunit delta